jgi:hypothetical protein
MEQTLKTTAVMSVTSVRFFEDAGVHSLDYEYNPIIA